jgi:hypothetical protein
VDKPRDPPQGYSDAPSRESLIERKLREAMADGSWSDLPHRGERLPLEDDSAAGDWALAHRMLRSAGMAPPWIESDKDARRWLAARDALLARARGAGALGSSWRRRELLRIVAAANDAIAGLNADAPSDRQHRRPLVLAAEIAALEAAEAAETEPRQGR